MLGNLRCVPFYIYNLPSHCSSAWTYIANVLSSLGLMCNAKPTKNEWFPPATEPAILSWMGNMMNLIAEVQEAGYLHRTGKNFKWDYCIQGIQHHLGTEVFDICTLSGLNLSNSSSMHLQRSKTDSHTTFLSSWFFFVVIPILKNRLLDKPQLYKMSVHPLFSSPSPGPFLC